MQHYCECGEYFELSYKQDKQLLRDAELFCSPECLSQYLDTLKCSRHNDPIADPMIDECQLPDPMDYWCSRTNRFYRSKSEAIAANYFIANDIEALYECFVIWFTRGKCYNPDFYLPYHNTWIEVKGLWQGAGKQKVRIAKKHGFRTVVIPDYLIRKMERDLRAVNLF